MGGIKFTDVFGYIYTSGTTGLPKAAKVTHARMYGLGGVGRLLGLGPGDVLYTCLPLYHTAGGGLGVMICLLQGPELLECDMNLLVNSIMIIMIIYNYILLIILYYIMI